MMGHKALEIPLSAPPPLDNVVISKGHGYFCINLTRCLPDMLQFFWGVLQRVLCFLQEQLNLQI